MTTSKGTIFAYRSVDISEWMVEKIRKRLEKFTIVKLEASAEVVARMDKLSIVNSVTAIFKDDKEKIYSLNNYASDCKGYEDNNNIRWLIDAIKEFEMQAILQFGSVALESTKDDTIPTVSKMEVKGIKEVGSIKLEIVFNATAEEMIMFLTNPRFFMWAGPSMKVEENSLSFDNVQMQKIEVKQSEVEMMYKWVDWKNFSKVKISFIKLGDCVQVILNQDGIPVKYLENVKTHWKDRIFLMISRMYNCAIKF